MTQTHQPSLMPPSMIACGGCQTACTPQSIRDMISTNDIVRVWFRKKDSTMRVITGTVHSKNIPSVFIPKNGRIVPDHQICLFDLGKRQWRSFRANSMVQIDIITT